MTDETDARSGATAPGGRILDEVFAAAITALTDAVPRVAGRFADVVAALAARRGKVVVTGVGKSGMVGLTIAATLNGTGTPAVFIHAGDALHGDVGAVTTDDVVLLLSKSADTPELNALLPALQRIGARCIGILGRTDTPLARALDICLDVSTDREACDLDVTPTASTTVMLVVGHAIAMALALRQGDPRERVALLHPGGHIGRRLLRRVRDVMTPAAALPTAPADGTFREAVAILDAHAFGAVFVVGQGRLQGIVTDGDVRRLFLATTAGATPVAAVMTATPVVVGPDVPLARAIELMETPGRKIYVLPVVEDGVLVGGLRMHDIVGR